ncbi:MAG: TolC family protein [Planctomycetes bacterium]|nr:TolC family protein [Planctomycetota bacterium]
MKSAVPWLVTISMVMVGCGGNRDQGFTDVQKTVGERTTAKIHWDQGSDEDQESAAAVRQLLSQEVSVDAAVQIALLNNRTLQAVYQELGVAQADLVRAGLLRNPVFDVSAKFARGGGVRLEMSIVEDFLDLFFIPMRKRLAETAIEGAKARVAGAVIDLASEVRVAVYRLQTATQALELRRMVVQAASAAYDLSQRLRAAGNIPKLDLLEQRGFFEQAKMQLGMAEIEVVELRERLNSLMGLWGEQIQWTIAPRLPDMASEEMAVDGLERRAIERSLDLAASRAEIAVNAQRLGIARPFGAVGNADLGVAAEKEIDGTWAAGPTASIPLPVFNFGQGAVAEARAELRRSQELYAAQAIEIRSRVRTARTRLLASRARVDYLRHVMLPLRQAAVEETQLQYNGMLASPFRLIQTKQNEIETGVDYVEALGGYWIALAMLNQLLDGRVPMDPGIDSAATSPRMMGGQMDRGH